MEKTFNDLLKPNQKRLDWHNQNRIWIDKADVLQLLQQVREATIAECIEIASRIDDAFVYEAINKLPTDRIRIEP